MSKEIVKQAEKFFKQMSKDAEYYKSAIPDKQLGEKLKKVSEHCTEVVKHIEERSGKEG